LRRPIVFRRLLIAPEGIEIAKTNPNISHTEIFLLIAPEGIEIGERSEAAKRALALLIAPEGIEI